MAVSTSPDPRALTSGGTSTFDTWTVVSRVVGTVIGLELIRAWLPSVIFVYGAAGSTPATEMGAFAITPFLAAVVLALVVRFLPARHVALLGAAAFVAARLWVQGTDGGGGQLWATTLGVAGLLVWWVASAATGAPRRSVALGHAGGLAFAAVLHALLRTEDLIWRGGAAAWLSTLLLVAAFVYATWASRDAVGDSSSGAAWFAFGPALVLSAMYAGAPSRFVATAGWTEWTAAAITAMGNVLGVALALLALHNAKSRLVPILLVLVGVGSTLLMPGGGGEYLLAAGLGGCLGVLGADTRTGSPTGRAIAAALGALLLFVVGFLYYAAYDIALPFPNAAAPALAAFALVLAAVRVRRPVAQEVDGSTRMRWQIGAVAIAATTAIALVVGGLVAVQVDTPTPAAGAGFPVRVMTYNLRMGHSAGGAYNPEDLAEVIRSENPDIVALQEVDRGWFLNGSHDSLTAIADALGMAYVWTPAADEVWGNAILSRYPLEDRGGFLLPQGDAPMARSVLLAVADLGGGAELAIVATHVHHVEEDATIRAPQIARVTEYAMDLAATYPTVVLGDMNAQPGAPELAPLDAAFSDAVAPFGPIATFPSTAPDRQIDHVYISSDLVASDLSVPQSEASDHLGIAVTLTLIGSAG